MKTVFFSLIAILILALLLFRPVPSATPQNLLTVEGVVTNIFEAGEYDVVFGLAGQDDFYYINRGLENQFNLEDLRDRLLGQEVEIGYPDYWSLVQGQSRHLSRLKIGDQTLFDEVRY